MSKEFDLSNYINKEIDLLEKNDDLIKVRFVKKFINEIENWCYKNNTIPIKNSRLKLAITDGGWVNVIQLMNFIKEKAGNLK